MAYETARIHAAYADELISPHKAVQRLVGELIGVALRKLTDHEPGDHG